MRRLWRSSSLSRVSAIMVCRTLSQIARRTSADGDGGRIFVPRLPAGGSFGPMGCEPSARQDVEHGLGFDQAQPHLGLVSRALLRGRDGPEVERSALPME